MSEFPAFIKNPQNAVKKEHQSPVPGIEGYIYDGVDGSQVIFWECPNGGKSDYHTHDFDEYFFVVEGSFQGDIGGKRVCLKAGEEILIPKGTPHNGEYFGRFRGVFAFSAKRAERESF